MWDGYPYLIGLNKIIRVDGFCKYNLILVITLGKSCWIAAATCFTGKKLFKINICKKENTYTLAWYIEEFEKAPFEPTQQLYQEKQKLESSGAWLEQNPTSDPGYQRTMQLWQQLPATYSCHDHIRVKQTKDTWELHHSRHYNCCHHTSLVVSIVLHVTPGIEYYLARDFPVVHGIVKDLKEARANYSYRRTKCYASKFALNSTQLTIFRAFIDCLDSNKHSNSSRRTTGAIESQVH